MSKLFLETFKPKSNLLYCGLHSFPKHGCDARNIKIHAQAQTQTLGTQIEHMQTPPDKSRNRSMSIRDWT